MVLGLGHATLTAVNGAVPMEVADVPGVIIAGVTIDAGLVESPLLLQVGKKNGSVEGWAGYKVGDQVQTHKLVTS